MGQDVLFPSKNSPPAGFQPQEPALDPDSSNPAKVCLGSPVAGHSMSPCAVPRGQGSDRARGLPCCAALLAGPCRARCCGSPGDQSDAESPQRGRGVWHLHGQGVREGSARGAALWDPPELQPRLLRELHPQVAAQPGLPERRHKVSGAGDVGGWSPSPLCALKFFLGVAMWLWDWCDFPAGG